MYALSDEQGEVVAAFFEEDVEAFGGVRDKMRAQPATPRIRDSVQPESFGRCRWTRRARGRRAVGGNKERAAVVGPRQAVES